MRPLDEVRRVDDDIAKRRVRGDNTHRGNRRAIGDVRHRRLLDLLGEKTASTASTATNANGNAPPSTRESVLGGAHDSAGDTNAELRTRHGGAVQDVEVVEPLLVLPHELEAEI